MKKKKVRLAANKGQHRVVIMWEKQTPHLKGSLVKDGRRQSRMTTNSPTWEITTSVGIPSDLPNPKCDATPRILKFSIKIAQFHSAPL